jgi:hypothetical protein
LSLIQRCPVDRTIRELTTVWRASFSFRASGSLSTARNRRQHRRLVVSRVA